MKMDFLPHPWRIRCWKFVNKKCFKSSAVPFTVTTTDGLLSLLVNVPLGIHHRQLAKNVKNNIKQM